jgi:mRNA interferase RelE/StbE
MKVIFLREFSKDIDLVSLKSIKLSLKRLIERMETFNELSKIPNTKKLHGHETAYRTRIGDYRLGFFFEDETIFLARFVHRKDI